MVRGLIFGEFSGIEKSQTPVERDILVQWVRICKLLCIQIFLKSFTVGGYSTYRPYWNDFLSYQLVDVIVWVVDSANRQRFQESRHALHHFLDNPAADRLPVIIVAAKQVGCLLKLSRLIFILCVCSLVFFLILSMI